ncbi:MAG: hypothetical protein KAW00_07245 [Dehalococcoidia bacterium]|nr:hypothetical protein [Dehalococcoidia bacterium]
MLKDRSLCEFVKASQVTSLIDIALVITYFVEQKRGKKWFFTTDLGTWFKEALIPPPANLHDVVFKATKSQFLIPDKTSKRMRYRLSQKGINRVEKQLEQVGLLATQGEETALLREVSQSLYASLKQIPDLDERGYIQEALTCLDPRLKAYRASILMGWAGAVYHLRKQVERAGFDKFCQVFVGLSLGKVKKINTIDDLEYYQEKDFLLVIEKMGIIDKAIRTQLETCLDLRNACGHPTQVRPQIHKVKSFFEDIIQYALSR